MGKDVSIKNMEMKSNILKTKIFEKDYNKLGKDIFCPYLFYF